MKKLLIFLTTCLCMVFCFTACGGDGGSTEESADNSPITEDEITALYTDADQFKGRTYEFAGKVLMVEKDGSDLYIQAYQDIENYENNTLVVYKDADVSVKEDEFIRVSGTVEGVFSGENAFGGDVNAPQIAATKVEKIDAMEAFPATKTVEVGQTVTKGSYEATVSKVDFTDKETRIYLTVKNNSSAEFDNYPDQGVIVQDGKQYESEWNEYYPEPSTELKPGVTSESVIAFKKVEEADFTYSFDGYSEDYDEVSFEFEIKVE